MATKILGITPEGLTFKDKKILTEGDYNANDVLAKIKTVDGSGSNLDADLLDGKHASAFSLSEHNHNTLYEPKNTNIQSHITDKSNPHSITKSQVGLGSVDNTSDLNKPISTATQSALNEKVNNSRVLTDVPTNAKFTDTNTTYSEISTAEIDAGTSSTLRTITGRRIKYILDKVQGWMNALTKSDVGLSNVDNVKQATKVEFDSHDTNTTKHITSAERTNWNSKETTASSQTKANQAEINAKNYADTELAKKVDKVTGKGLSTEDYTTAEKSKLASVEQNANYTPNLSMNELILGSRFKVVYNDIEDSLDIEVI